LFFAWLFHPKSMGAAVVYKNVKWVWIFGVVASEL
jgi:hypothetical protein